MPQRIIHGVKEFDGHPQICVTPNGWIDDDSFILSMRMFLSQLRQSSSEGNSMPSVRNFLHVGLKFLPRVGRRS